MLIEVVGVLGLLLCVYAICVEEKAKKKNYKAVCDINDHMSCSKAFSSKYGKTMGMSNSIYGIVFYVAVLLLAYLGYTLYVFYLSALAIVGSVYLASVLYFKLKDFCLVCTSIYAVNIVLFIASYMKLF